MIRDLTNPNHRDLISLATNLTPTPSNFATPSNHRYYTKGGIDHDEFSLNLIVTSHESNTESEKIRRRSRWLRITYSKLAGWSARAPDSWFRCRISEHKEKEKDRRKITIGEKLSDKAEIQNFWGEREAGETEICFISFHKLYNKRLVAELRIYDAGRFWPWAFFRITLLRHH